MRNSIFNPPQEPSILFSKSGRNIYSFTALKDPLYGSIKHNYKSHMVLQSVSYIKKPTAKSEWGMSIRPLGYQVVFSLSASSNLPPNPNHQHVALQFRGRSPSIAHHLQRLKLYRTHYSLFFFLTDFTLPLCLKINRTKVPDNSNGTMIPYNKKINESGKISQQTFTKIS